MRTAAVHHCQLAFVTRAEEVMVHRYACVAKVSKLECQLETAMTLQVGLAANCVLLTRCPCKPSASDCHGVRAQLRKVRQRPGTHRHGSC